MLKLGGRLARAVSGSRYCVVADRHGILVLVCMLPGDKQKQECPDL